MQPSIEIACRNNAVLDHWAAGRSIEWIGGRLSISPNLVKVIAHRARKAGDVRAVNRKRVLPIDRDLALRMWEAGATEGQTARALRTTTDVIHSIVNNARAAGDPRAVYHSRSPISPAAEREGGGTVRGGLPAAHLRQPHEQRASLGQQDCGEQREQETVEPRRCSALVHQPVSRQSLGALHVRQHAKERA
jgi:hypothetical protein